MNSVHAPHTRQFHTERISHVVMKKKKKRPSKINKMSKQKPALDKRKQQLVTCIQLATEHIRDQKTDTNPNKRNVYSIKSANQIEYDRREARSRDFQSNSREKYKQRNMRWTDSVHLRERDGDLERDLQFSSVLFIRVLHYLGHLMHWKCTSIYQYVLPGVSLPK